MRIKKSGGRIIGAEMTAAEKKAMNIEIQRQIADYIRNNTNEIDAMILWHLHETFGFGHKRLKRFYDTFGVQLQKLLERYEVDDSEKVWLCTYKLKEYGIGIEEWNNK